jgi:hypothetical protein
MNICSIARPVCAGAVRPSRGSSHGSHASFREIAAMLTKRGVQPKRGSKVWYASSAMPALLSRPKVTTERSVDEVLIKRAIFI